jgi:hypothetical protein
VALLPKLIMDGRRREGRAWCADLLMDVDMLWGSCEVRVVQKEAHSPIVVRMSLAGVADEMIMLCIQFLTSP